MRIKAISFVIASMILASSSHASDEAFKESVAPFLQRFCVKCHNEKRTDGELDLTQFKGFDDTVKQATRWENLTGRVRANEMPPEGAKLPPNELRQKFVKYARLVAAKVPKNDCNTIASDHTQNFYSGHVMSRRLSRGEYDNTIRDLIGLDLQLSREFPSDGAGGEGFDTTGDALFTSAIHIERYLAAANRTMGILFESEKQSRFTPSQIKSARDKLIFVQPDAKLQPKEAAKQILERFIARAFRRPSTKEDLDRFLPLFEKAMARGDTFEKSIQLPIKAILISPNFLFLVEPEPEKEGVYPLGGYPLAARLSFFLWSSMPDDELTRLAAQNELQNDDVLKQQVVRMLRDPKAKGFAEQFTQQWLGLRSLGTTIKPDSKLYPGFDASLAEAMRQEPALVFHRIFKENRSLLELLNGKETFANAKLAKLYGIEKIQGEELQLVSLQGIPRGGVITMPGTLAATSYPTRTSPVLRGKWILEDILGAKVPPPPPGVSELPEGKPGQGLTMKQRFELHRTKAECASCHARMDPLGFALENYDPLGRFRTEDHGVKIDSSGQLPSGEKFNNMDEFQKILLNRKDEFARNLTRKMLGYALGRQLYPFDNCVIDESMKKLKANGYKPQDLVETVVLSYPFRNRYGKK
jgi:hypothetical protein